jgi:O-antigen/teichoic acid export membrane protein
MPHPPTPDSTAGAFESDADADAGSPLAAADTGQRAVRGGAIRIVSTVVGLLVTLVSAPLVVRHLGGAEFGRMATAQSLVTIATAIIEGGLTNVAIRQYALGSRSDRSDLIRDLVGFRLASVALAGVLVVGYAVLAGFDDQLVFATTVAMTGLLLSAYQTAIATPLAADLELTAMSVLDILRSSVSATVQVSLVVLGASMVPFLLAPAIAYGAAALVTIHLVRSRVRVTPRFDGRAWVGLLRETGIYTIATALGAVCFQLALQILKIVGTAQEVGDYAVAFRVVEIGNLVPWVAVGAVFPVLVHAGTHDRQRFGYVLRTTYRALLVVGLFVALCLVVGAPVAIQLVAGAAHDGATEVLRVIGLAAPATYLVALGSLALLALHRYRALLVCNAAALCLALAGGIVLADGFGASGAASATVLVEWTLAVSYAAVLGRAGHTRELVSGRSALVLCAAAAAYAAGITADGAGAFMALVVAVAVYVVANAAIRSLPVELWMALPEPLRRFVPRGAFGA